MLVGRKCRFDWRDSLGGNKLTCSMARVERNAHLSSQTTLQRTIRTESIVHLVSQSSMTMHHTYCMMTRLWFSSKIEKDRIPELSQSAISENGVSVIHLISSYEYNCLKCRLTTDSLRQLTSVYKTKSDHPNEKNLLDLPNSHSNDFFLLFLFHFPLSLDCEAYFSIVAVNFNQNRQRSHSETNHILVYHHIAGSSKRK